MHFIWILGFFFCTKIFAGEMRGAFDVGSGTTRLTVAEVDPNTQKILQVYYPTYETKGSIKVSYQDFLNQNKNNAFDATTLDLGKKAILTLKNEALAELKKNKKLKSNDLKKIKWAGIVTGAFRKATNGKESAEKLSKETGVNIHIVDVSEEGKLGFLSMMQKKNVDIENIVVWDIAGATEQFVYYQKTDKVDQDPFHVFATDMASEVFKSALMKELKKEGNSPNPIGKEGLTFGKKYASKIAEQVPLELKKKLIDEKTMVIGIGGVHAASIKNQVMKKDQDFYTYYMIEAILPERVMKTDQEIASDYAATNVSNLILVAGQMAALKINKVYPLKVSNVEGALVRGIYWNN